MRGRSGSRCGAGDGRRWGWRDGLRGDGQDRLDVDGRTGNGWRFGSGSGRVGVPAPNGGGANGTVARGKLTVGGRVGLDSGVAEYATINRIINGRARRVRVAHNWRTRTGTWYGTGG